jgi:hypothetical protein
LRYFIAAIGLAPCSCPPLCQACLSVDSTIRAARSTRTLWHHFRASLSSACAIDRDVRLVCACVCVCVCCHSDSCLPSTRSRCWHDWTHRWRRCTHSQCLTSHTASTTSSCSRSCARSLHTARSGARCCSACGSTFGAPLFSIAGRHRQPQCRRFELWHRCCELWHRGVCRDRQGLLGAVS